MLYYVGVKEFIEVLRLQKTLEEFKHIDDVPELMDTLILCNDFIAACRVSEESDWLAFGEYSRRQQRTYDGLIKAGAI